MPRSSLGGYREFATRDALRAGLSVTDFTRTVAPPAPGVGGASNFRKNRQTPAGRETSSSPGYHRKVRLFNLFMVLALATLPAFAQGLPELGDVSSDVLSPQIERRVGEQAMREIERDPQYVDDPELAVYINTLGQRLVSANPDARQDFEFFFVRDNTVNAFAMPGGFVGVHTGLILAAQTESEAAAVLAHEIAHVTQHHIARMLGKQSQSSIPTLAAMLVAMLAARGRPDLAQAAMATATARNIQSQLDYSRDFEREADRVGFQILQQSGFDVHAMPSFFERLQKSSRVYENNAPAYLRTHPLTSERIADMENRAQNALYKQTPDSLEFHLVRAKLRSDQGTTRDAVALAEEQLREHRYASEIGARHGFVSALLRAGDTARAESELAKLRKITEPHPMVELLAARIKSARNDGAGARDGLRAALARFPNYRPLQYAYVEAMQTLGAHADAIASLADMVKNFPRDARLYGLQAKSFAALGRGLALHQALAEQYYLRGAILAAIDQLQIAQRSGDGDFYQLSSVEARLRELRRQQAEEAKRK